MGRLIIKITDPKDNTDYYMEWSTVLDAPVSTGLSLENFIEYYTEEYGRNGIEDLEARLQQVEKTGCSSRTGITLEQCLSSYQWLRGKRSDALTEILDEYCRDQ